MLINVRGWRWRHFVFLVAVRKSGVVVRVVVVMIDRTEVAVVGCVSLSQHVWRDEIRGLRVQRVAGLRWRRLDVRRRETREAQVVFCNEQTVLLSECFSSGKVFTTGSLSTLVKYSSMLQARLELMNFMAFNIAINYLRASVSLQPQPRRHVFCISALYHSWKQLPGVGEHASHNWKWIRKKCIFRARHQHMKDAAGLVSWSPDERPDLCPSLIRPLI